MKKVVWTAAGFGGLVALTLILFVAFFRPMDSALSHGYHYGQGHGIMSGIRVWDGWWMPVGALLVWGLAITLGVVLATVLLRTRAEKKG